MKMFKLKYLTVTILAVLISGCSTADIDELKNETIQGKYSELLQAYNSFKLDGKKITNTKEVINLLSSSIEVTDYNPEGKEISFYTTETEFRKANDKNKETDVNDEVPYSTNSRVSPDLGQFGADAMGIGDLGNFLDQQYFRDFSNNIFLTVHAGSSIQSGAFWFYRLNNDSSYNDTTVSLRLDNDIASYDSEGASFGLILSFVNNGLVKSTIKNDTGNNRKIYFYQNQNYSGKFVTISLNKNKFVTLAKGLFDPIGGRALSYKSVNM